MTSTASLGPLLLAWTCHICGELRPDAAIGVCSSDIGREHHLGPGIMYQNVRFCRDRPACVSASRTFRICPLSRASCPEDDPVDSHG